MQIGTFLRTHDPLALSGVMNLAETHNFSQDKYQWVIFI
jgi:hypothetical protein